MDNPMEQIKVELQDWMGDDRAIGEAAWTSSTTLAGKANRTDADVERVVNMLIRDKHATPVEAVVFRFWIKMPIASDRQHVTHRIATHNGASGRYRTMPSEFLNMQDDVDSILVKAFGEDEGSRLVEKYYRLCTQANDFYQDLLKRLKQKQKDEAITNQEYKRAREFMRGVLPQHNMTERVTVINLRSFANYMKLRNSEHAQPEIRKVAELMLEEVKRNNVCPVAISALEKNGWNI